MKYDINNEVIEDIKDYIIDLTYGDGDCIDPEIAHLLKLLEHLTGVEWYIFYDRTTDKWYLDYEED